MALLHPCSCTTPPSPSPILPFKNSTPNRLLFTSPALCRRFPPNRLTPRLKAALAVESPAVSGKNSGGNSPEILLEVKDLSAVIAESKQPILKGVNLSVYEGEVHVVMGKNGSGKSTFAKVLVGHPDYVVTGGSIVFKGENVLDMDPEERSLAGLFMSFQSPIEIPGVSNIDFLQMAYNARRRKLGQPELSPIEFYGYISPKLELVNMKVDFLNRNVNEGFSGGERKRNEIFQLAVLGADLAILDEIDSGLDVDALRDVAKAVNGILTTKNSVLMITHYHRLLEYIEPTYVHIMEGGRIVETGKESVAKRIEKEGYNAIPAA
ncbi:ABC transporter I family member 6, chloroplastic [Rhododendron vialii]|uniref:ABC transporter I family member 6, chloroplastic n=1 Tax=Rhododendron vialii TaxID=182163 RepID=UPI00265E50D4|nr:ABC transporter I family member 6, chloroplastic [Rhododendron vialii]